MKYTLKNISRKSRNQNSLLKTIFDELEKSLEEREIQAKTNLGTATKEDSIAENSQSSAPDNVWDLGRAMWDDGIDHLPSKWIKETIPKVLNLHTVPTINCYKALMRQVQAGMVSGMPGFEFMHNDYEVAEKLDEEWRDFVARSRFLGESDSVDEDALNFGIGYLGFVSRGDKLRGVAVDPQMVLWYPPTATRYQDVDAVAQVSVEYIGKKDDDQPPSLITKNKWSPFLRDRQNDGSYKVKVELWVRPGTRVGDIEFEGEGIHAIIRSDDKVLLEEPYTLDVVPIVPQVICPSKQMIGQSQASELWQAQVRIDKLLAKLLWCAQYSGADKYRIAVNLRGQSETQTPAINLTEASSPEKELKNGGIGVVFGDQGMVEKFPATMSIADLHAEFEAAKRDMEYLAGISQPYQGIEPERVTAGVAINSLAMMSSKGVQRKATFKAEGLREYAMTWAKFMLSQWGMEAEGLDVMVNLVPQEELTKARQVETLVKIADIIARSNLPQLGEFLTDLIPGLSIEQRMRLKEILAQSQMGTELMPETPDGALPPGSEDNQPPVPEQGMADEYASVAPMSDAFAPLPNAPNVTY